MNGRLPSAFGRKWPGTTRTGFSASIRSSVASQFACDSGVCVSAIHTWMFAATGIPPTTVRSDGIHTNVRSGVGPSSPTMRSFSPSTLSVSPSSGRGTMIDAGALSFRIGRQYASLPSLLASIAATVCGVATIFASGNAAWIVSSPK
ncbi:hypothetical protein FEP92_05225 [Burkholderia multivorans]|nr:hypothetical protein [Burkholderia multivorans]MDR8864951.1 hypothetical protein [Burkholderia multivorans]